jgi:tetratricopeptide (TPR) repeat protein
LAEDHCHRAIALDPALPEGHLARSWILWSPVKNFQHAEAIAALEQVLIARPNFERAHNRMATICLHIGRLEEARIAHELAQRANPKTRTGNLEYFHIYSGDFARAEELAEAWLHDSPRSVYALGTYALTALLSGNVEAAEQRVAEALEKVRDDAMLVSFQGILHARRGKTERALQCVRQALDFPQSFGHTHHAHHYIASVYAELGDTVSSIAWLERAADTGFPCWPFFQVDPCLQNLRGEPAFRRLLASLEQTYTALKIDKL